MWDKKTQKNGVNISDEAPPPNESANPDTPTQQSGVNISDEAPPPNVNNNDDKVDEEQPQPNEDDNVEQEQPQQPINDDESHWRKESLADKLLLGPMEDEFGVPNG